MNGKPKAKPDEEFRMSASEFDGMMRDALSAPPLDGPKKTKRTAKKTARPERQKKK